MSPLLIRAANGLLETWYAAPVAWKRYSQRPRPLARDTKHYRTLGISPKATQSEIKQAYYKLSKEFHPDKNRGCKVAADRFRQVTEAYEVLGTYSSRKLYDRGLSDGGVVETERGDSGEPGPRPRTRYAGRTDTYDFDEWTRNHYRDMFERKAEAVRGTSRTQASKKARYDAQAALMKGIVLVLGIIFATSFAGYLTPSYDVPVARLSDQKRDRDR